MVGRPPGSTGKWVDGQERRRITSPRPRPRSPRETARMIRQYLGCECEYELVHRLLHAPPFGRHALFPDWNRQSRSACNTPTRPPARLSTGLLLSWRCLLSRSVSVQVRVCYMHTRGQPNENSRDFRATCFDQLPGFLEGQLGAGQQCTHHTGSPAEEQPTNACASNCCDMKPPKSTATPAADAAAASSLLLVQYLHICCGGATTTTNTAQGTWTST
ncbi:hypothetical protein B0T19DRAFT_153938 [Cercophora scortea]|uniref:Uncharacterized protein n=1 Tax=Cercophora scortea TaxID=314031 RepID=A0AAE0IL28_9PEZI|nr:hypothetical protein B0T19DRAFT_153938 [Cercophora scortea]